MDNIPFALPMGTVIAGYEIKRVLGVGGFGITYEGFNPVTKRKAAIKEFFPRGIASRENTTHVVYARQDSDVVNWALERFRRSTTELCDFKHPNIVPVLNYVPAHETGYMFMEQVEGETLEQWLRARGDKLTFADIQAMLDPVCDALEYVHSRKFIHRDIAPDNIMVRADGSPMLIDFGAIKIIAQQTQLRATAAKSFGVAKQHYSPPEQLDEDAQLDPRADVYALGAVLYRAVTGNPPVDAEKRKTDLILKGADSYVPVATNARVAIPTGASETIDRALSLRPDGRQASIAELRAALKGDSTETALVQATQLQRPVPMPTPGFSAPPAQAKPAAAVAPSSPPWAATTPVYTPPPAAAAYTPSDSQGAASGRAPGKSKSWIGIAAIAAVVLIIGGVFVSSRQPTTTATAPVRTEPLKQQPQKQTLPQKQTTPQKQTAPQKQTQQTPEDPRIAPHEPDSTPPADPAADPYNPVEKEP